MHQDRARPSPERGLIHRLQHAGRGERLSQLRRGPLVGRQRIVAQVVRAENRPRLAADNRGEQLVPRTRWFSTP